ncbi:MAG TPA: glycoside hydrolase family 36 protein [Ktedonobacterales bacterium]|nr:glycoside hydrolase family 36 protein [Ktedonobacterales bacterium]
MAQRANTGHVASDTNGTDAAPGTSLSDGGEVRWMENGTLSLRQRAGEVTSELAGGLVVELLDARGRPFAVRAIAAETAVIGAGVVAAGAEERWRRTLTVPFAGFDPDGSGHHQLTCDVTLTASGEIGLVRLDVSLRNMGTAPVTVRRVFPFVAGPWWPGGALRLKGRDGRYAAYKNGWQSWSYAGSLPLGTRDPRSRVPTLVAFHQPGGASPRLPFSRRVDVVSEEMALIGRPGEGVAALTGFLSADQWLGQVFVGRRQGALAAAVLLDDRMLAPGERVELPPLVLALGNPDVLLRRYAKAVAAELHARPARPAPSGWCSWYYYFTGVSEAALNENIAEIARLRETLPLDLFQIDDGYQMAVGDWLSVNDKFPGGMAPLAVRIREAGLRPGIWLAPFTVAATSALARKHPDWLVRDAVSGKPAFAGHNWETDLHGLDTTHPDARDWLRTVIATIVRGWGYDYLKLDFLASAAIPGRRHDPAATRASALRDGLALIREVAGDDVLILGCGCPLASAVGVVDAMRIGPDSAPYWFPRYKGLPLPFAEGHSLPNMEGAIRNTLTRAWTAPAWWVNDPDCLLVRERGSDLTLDEVRAFATAVGLTGGMVVVSDRLRELTAERLRIVQCLLPPLAERVLPLPSDLFGFGIPERVRLRIARSWGEWLLVVLFNGQDVEREMPLTWGELGLDAGAYHAVEFWSGAYLGRSESGIAPRVVPHGAAALAIRRETDPEAPLLLSTSFHIGQGAVEIAAWEYDAAERTLRWRAEIGKTMAGAFMLWLPVGLTPRLLTTTATEAGWRREASGVVIVSARVAGTADFALRLEGGS